MTAPLFDVGPPGAGTIETAARHHLDLLRKRGLLQAEHELLANLVVHLARVTDRTTKGYAVAQVAKELREAIEALPAEQGGDPWDELAAHIAAAAEADR